MDNSVETKGKTVEEAIEKALKELDVNRDEIEVEVIDEGNKGIFGIIGSKDAVIKAQRIFNGAEIAETFLLDVFNTMRVEAEIIIEENENRIKVDVSGDDVGILIGRRGETLDAIQYLTSLSVNRKIKQYKKVIVDIENYREKRKKTLQRLANKMARKATKSNRPITLEPMNPYERRIIHSTLQKNKVVKTYSKGEEPHRRVVITKK